jgi:hypothetical protein
MAKSILSVLQGTGGYHVSYLQAVADTIAGFLAAYSGTIFPSFFPVSVTIFMAACEVLVFASFKKQKQYGIFIITLMLPILFLIILHHGILDQFFVALLPVFLLVTALFIDFLWQKSKVFGIIVLSIFVVGNLGMWWSTIPQNKSMFFQSTQPDLHYADQLATIDSIYEEAHGQSFSFQSYTIPYWEQQGWEYLFWSYGQKKYGYGPVAEKAKTLFVIIQQDPSNQPFQQDWLKNTVSKWGKVEKMFTHGILTTEKLEVEKM